MAAPIQFTSQNPPPIQREEGHSNLAESSSSDQKAQELAAAQLRLNKTCEFACAKSITASQNANKPSSFGKKAFATLIYLGILAAIIGFAGIIPNCGLENIPIIKNCAIMGIPLEAALGLLAFGEAAIIALIILKINSAKKDKVEEDNKPINKTIQKAADLYESFQKVRSDGNLDSNINDLLGVLAFVCLATTFIAVPGLVIDCLSNPFGMLLIFSGLYQALEAKKALDNAKKDQDKAEVKRQWINIINSILLIALGAFATGLGLNNELTIIISCISGVISFGLALESFIHKTKPNLDELNNVIKDSDSESEKARKIKEYLNKKLTLTNEETKDINTAIQNLKKDDNLDSVSITTWINNNIENLDKEAKQYFNKIKELTSYDQNQLKEIEKRIFIEETRKKMMKIESFKALVSSDTYQKVVEATTNGFKNQNNSDMKDTDVIKLFTTCKKEMKTKMYAEVAKCFIYAGFALSPVPKWIFPTLNMIIYNIAMALVCLASFIIGAIARFRNVPPAEKKEEFKEGDYTKIEKSNDSNSSLKLNCC